MKPKRLSQRSKLISASMGTALPNAAPSSVKLKDAIGEDSASAILNSPALEPSQSGLLPLHLQGPWLLDYDDLNLTRLVDEDRFNEIYFGTYRGEHEVAVKKLSVTTWGESMLEEVARQARIRCRLNHPNINPFLGYTEFPSVCLVSAWCINGSLEDLLRRCHKDGTLLPRAFAARVLSEVASAIAYLQSLRPQLIHRTLSTRKVLLDGKGRAVVTDFTLAASVVLEGPMFKPTRRVVDPPHCHPPPAPWAAPELQKGAPYDLSADVYSWGVVAQEVSQAAEMGAVDKSLVDRCTNPDPNGRPDIDDVLAGAQKHATEVRAFVGGSDEEDMNKLGLQMREDLPGEATMQGWSVAPKFKLMHEDLDYGEFVAEGGFSEIYKGTYKGKAVAIKKLKTWLLGEDTLDEFQKEAEVLASLFHPNILVMVGITIFPSLCIVTPWAERGSLDRLLYKNETPISPILMLSMMLGIARGILYLHSVGIIHRDIKAANVLVGKHFNPRLADFGLSVRKRRVPEPQPDLISSAGVPSPPPAVHAPDATDLLHQVHRRHQHIRTITETPEREAHEHQQHKEPSTPPHTPLRFGSSPGLLPPTAAAGGGSEPPARPMKAVSRLVLSPFGRPVRPLGGSSIPIGASHPIGTWPWQAPEVITCQLHDERCDIFSFAVTMWEMWARMPPFGLLSPEESGRMLEQSQVYRPPLSHISSVAPKDAVLLIARCWLQDPSDRPSVPVIIQSLAAILKAVANE